MNSSKKNLRDYSKVNSADTSPILPIDTDSELDFESDTPPTHAEVSEFSVPLDCGGLRLDQVLAKLLPDYSRSRLQEWVAQGQVTVNDAPAISKQKVWGGERLQVMPQQHPTEQAYIAQAIDLNVIYEDESILVLHKPVGLVVHPGNGNWQGTLLNGLLHYAPELAEVPRAGIVHRLDKDTSGLLVVARTVLAQTALVRQLQERSVRREYLALVHGEMERGGRVDAPIDRHPSQRTKMAVVEGGKPAVTHYSIVQSFPGCTLLRCKLETGRTHQIRVHLAHLRHPLVGDSVYIKGAQKCPPAMRDTLLNFPRQALHAERLGLTHPASGEWMEWQTDMPNDMKNLLNKINNLSNESH